jgi:prepilin-type N-terminal cleavage/methylation domain-containing protein
LRVNAKGFTLLELLIAMSIAIVISAAGYTFFTNTFKFSVVHSRNIEMQRETRGAIDLISREIRAAGFGVRNPLASSEVHPAAALFPIITAGNNVDPDPSGVASQIDRIALWGGFQQIGMLTCAAPPCANPVAAEGVTQVLVQPTPGTDPTNPTVVGATITLDGFYVGTVTAIGGPNGNGAYTLTLGSPLNRDYSQNNSVLRLQQIVYSVVVPGGETEPVLFRSDDGVLPGQRLASGIEDLQFAYLLSNGTAVNNPGAVAATSIPSIRAVRIGMLARAQDPSQNVNSVSTRPTLEDHAAGGAADRFHRRLIRKVAEVRNLGF